MRKIDRLKVALKTGAFWFGFPAKPVTDEFTTNRREFEVKSHDLWDKYRRLLKRYGENDIRFMALYNAHRRDLIRLIQKYEAH